VKCCYQLTNVLKNSPEFAIEAQLHLILPKMALLLKTEEIKPILVFLEMEFSLIQMSYV
jgi:hypothetical protein